MATKVKQLLSHNGTRVFYAAVTADRDGNYKQFTQDEVEKAGTGKFEIVESDRSRHILSEFVPLAESLGPGWVKVPIRESRRDHHQLDSPEEIAKRLRSGFAAIGLTGEEAAVAARGPEDQYVTDTQGRGNRLVENLMTVER
jgi:hypothetical protein